MSRALVVALAFAFSGWSNNALANGGGYAFGVKFTGGIAPFQASGTEDIQIVEERLDIQLRQMDALVVVRYSMRNPSDRPAKVRFGFPVEEGLGEEGETFSNVDPDYARHGSKHHVEAYQDLRNYRVTLDGSLVKSEFATESFGKGLVKPFPGSQALENIEGWMVSEVTFPPATTVLLEIGYAVGHFTSGTYVSDDDRANARTFVYRLSTGAVWRGPIAKGTVTIRADGIPADEVEIVAPRGRFKRGGQGWTWIFDNLEPTLADDITVRATPAYLEVGAYGDRENGSLSFLERAGAWGVSHQRFKASASSSLASTGKHSYGPGNVVGGHGMSPWCEGVPGSGAGEWLQLSPAKAAPLLGIGILPGVVAGGEQELYEANGSPIRIEVLLNDEHRFVATLGDRIANQFIPISGYVKPVSKVRITFLEVRPGTKYADTCITRVVVYDRLKKQPRMQGAR